MNELAGLNPEQLQAVTYTNGSMLVLAGAGSGKTRVLTTRIAWLVLNNLAYASEILAVTFTNKAAREMSTRVSAALNFDSRSLWIGTFHSIALRILTKHYHEAHLPSNFQILDSNDQLGLLKRIIRSANLEDDRNHGKDLQKFINQQKEHGIRSNMVNPSGLRQEQWLKLYKNYEEICNREGLVDFTELLLRCYELFINNPQVLQLYHNMFRHILVDEFQDTNQLQYKWLKTISNSNAAVFAVGDDDQSIYAFRGADVTNMQSFMKDFKISQPIRLEQNYRSSPNILEAANAIISNNNDRIGKNLWTEKQSGAKIKWYEGYTEEDEAYFVLDEIKTLVRDGTSLDEIAVLYRSNAQSRIFEQLFYNNQINYRVYGGLRFFDRQEIKHVLSYLRLILNPDDNEAFLRVVNFPPRGIGNKTVESLQLLAEKNQISLYRACDLLGGKQKLTNFTELLRLMRERTKSLTLAETMTYVIEMSGLVDHYKIDKNNGLERLENLNELVSSSESLTLNGATTSLSEFLLHAVMESGETQADNHDASVQLMTVHAAKGLEFKVVFLCGLEDGLFPHDNALISDANLAEERRLMYVAITRAKEVLYLLRACSRSLWGKRELTVVSRFIHEIPSNLISNISGLSNIGRSDLMEFGVQGKEVLKTLDNPESKISHFELSGNNNISIKIGDMINHSKFGDGKVINLNCDGKKSVAEIYFIGFGSKTLDLSIAKLTKLRS